MNYATNVENPPSALAFLQRWSISALIVTGGVFIGLTWWLSKFDQPITTRGLSWSEPISPYPGLEPFDERYTSVFFGRDQEIVALSRRINPPSRTQSSQTLVVTGPSGAGKSSVIRAGLLPQLALRAQWITVGPFTPDTNPFAGLAQALSTALQLTTSASLESELRHTGAPALCRHLDALRSRHRGGPRPVLIAIDQAEELLTLVSDEERDALLGLLDAALAADPRLKVLFTFRSEFLTRLGTLSHAHLFRDTFILGPVPRRSLFKVVAEPAARSGISFEPGLVDLIVSEASGGDALPLMAYTLHALVPEPGRRQQISLQEYEAIGGVAGALTERADLILSDLTEASPDVPVLPTLLKFVTITDGQPSQRPVRRDTLAPSQQAVAEVFLAERLLVSDGDGSEPILRVAHEALFRQWQPLRQAIEAAAQDLALASDVERWAAEWDAAGRHDSYLLRDERLRRALGWMSRQPDAAAARPVVAEFLESSRRADEAAMRWLSQTVAQRALVTVEDDPESGLLLALAALEDCADTHLARLALVTALASTRMCVPLTGHTALVQRVVWSTDGQHLATACYDGTVRIWRATDGAVEQVIDAGSGYVHGVAWSPDGRRLVTAGHDGTARIWSARDGSSAAVLTGHDAEIRGVAWSPDGTVVATASQDGTVRLWDPATAQQTAVLTGHDGFVHGVAFAPDGSRLATSGRDRVVRIWDVADHTLLGVLEGHQELVRTVAWSPGGQLLASAGYDHTIRVWDVAAGRATLAIPAAKDLVQSVTWAPDGTRLASAASDCTARVWDAATGFELVALHGHHSVVRDVAWSPDGARIATVANDGSGRIWDLMRPDDVVVLRGHEALVEAAAWSPDGRRLSTASFDCTARVWDAQRGTWLHTLEGHQDPVRDVAWSPDARFIATASNDRTMRIWSAATGQALHTLQAHPDRIEGVAWSPDGTRVATSSHDRTVRVWDATTWALVHTFTGHEDLIRDVCWSPDSTRLASAGVDRTVRIWDADTGAQLHCLTGFTDFAQAVAWSPDGDRVACVSYDKTLRIYAAADGGQIRAMTGHEDTIRDVCWSPDGRLAATASADGTARIWDVDQGAELLILGVHSGGVESVAWSPDGARLATAARDQTVRVWSVATDLQTLIDRAHSRTSRALSAEERRRHGLR
ncbi:eIF2A-related protein [Streptomyces sp. SLBN-118]|uniref:nSTAND1 domain-containing NTPase n=1 Tax=Streptomyces sp. SLBN-118 TaxID=2768454 RepID=UPI0013599751|nr:AAA family ATPase [Streptomyces sp. SLBN-118]